MFRKIFFTLLSLALTFFVQAQDTLVVKADREATGLRAEGKIYVVLVVSSTILIGLFIYLIRLDRKLTRLEKNK
jgi:hypothetical protein